MSNDELIILPHHVVNAGLCITGARAWFDHYNMSFEDFRRGKVTASKMLETGDSLAVRVVDRARSELDKYQ